MTSVKLNIESGKRETHAVFRLPAFFQRFISKMKYMLDALNTKGENTFQNANPYHKYFLESVIGWRPIQGVAVNWDEKIDYGPARLVLF